MVSVTSTWTEPENTPLALLLLGQGTDPASERGVDCPGDLPRAVSATGRKSASRICTGVPAEENGRSNAACRSATSGMWMT